MPNAKNFPTDYDDYLILAETSTKKEALLLLNRFAFRYRLSVDFTGMIAPKVGRTLAGYNVITKIFLAYTAYEAIYRSANSLRVLAEPSISSNMITHSELAKKLKANKKLKSYLLSYKHSDDLAIKVKLFFNETTNDIACIAFALRNIFAHGDLTASAIATDTVAKRLMFIVVPGFKTMV